jgi:hypothetical protein
MLRRWVGRMWLLLVCNGLENSVDSRLRSADMFKKEYWFRVVSVRGMHKTSGFRHRSHYQDPNCMATAVKWRHTAPTVSEDDEKADTTEDEKTSAGLTTTAYFRRTWQHSMWFNGKIVACRVFEQDLSQTSHNYFRLERHYRVTAPVLKSISTGAIPPSRGNWISISSLLHRCLECTSTRRLHLPKCVFTIPVMVRGDVQVVSGRRTGR